jgi:CheY-like chemotaxis protein
LNFSKDTRSTTSAEMGYTNLIIRQRREKLGAKKILIVDDYEESCKLLAEILSSNYECYYTSDSTKSMELVAQKRPDLILLDYKMPGLMGVDVCRLIRAHEHAKSTPIIFVSGAATIDERIKAFETGFEQRRRFCFRTRRCKSANEFIVASGFRRQRRN